MTRPDIGFEAKLRWVLPGGAPSNRDVIVYDFNLYGLVMRGPGDPASTRVLVPWHRITDVTWCEDALATRNPEVPSQAT